VKINDENVIEKPSIQEEPILSTGLDAPVKQELKKNIQENELIVEKTEIIVDENKESK